VSSFETGVSVTRTPESDRETTGLPTEPRPTGSESRRPWTDRLRRFLPRSGKADGVDGQAIEKLDQPDEVLPADATEGVAKPGAWQPLPVQPPEAEPSASPTRGPAWLLAVLDFIERATGRTTSLREHLTMFIVYVLMILLTVAVVIGGAVVLVVNVISIGTWPGITSIVVLAASAGGAVFVKRAQRDATPPATGPTSASTATESTSPDVTEAGESPKS
jgi:hypothetical protein